MEENDGIFKFQMSIVSIQKRVKCEESVLRVPRRPAYDVTRDTISRARRTKKANAQQHKFFTVRQNINTTGKYIYIYINSYSFASKEDPGILLIITNNE